MATLFPVSLLLSPFLLLSMLMIPRRQRPLYLFRSLTSLCCLLHDFITVKRGDIAYS